MKADLRISSRIIEDRIIEDNDSALDCQTIKDGSRRLAGEPAAERGSEVITICDYAGPVYVKILRRCGYQLRREYVHHDARRLGEMLY